LPVGGAYMDFPGFGTIVRKGSGFAFVRSGRVTVTAR
jgi:hypothetical protein